MAIDVSDVKSKADLLAIVETDLGTARHRNGRWYQWPCPFHDDGERDGGSLRVTPDTGTWFCFGCHAHGDAIDWVQRRQGLKFGEACRQIGGSAPVPTHFDGVRVGARRASPLTPAPDDNWRVAAERVVATAEQCLSNSSGATAYLNARGLNAPTISLWHLGYTPGRYNVPEIVGADGNPATTVKGITIPIYAGGKLWAVKTRQADGLAPKYLQLYGSRPALFGADTLSGKSTVVLTEGEFDAMLLHQEAGDIVGVASTTGGAKTWRKEWAPYLIGATTILLAYDTDQTGEEAAVMMAATLGARARRVSVPTGKDVTDYWKAGGDVRAWVEGLMPGVPPRPTRGCPICMNAAWHYVGSDWACTVCRP